MIPLKDENPTRRVPWTNYGLILLCTGFFLWQMLHTPEGMRVIVETWGLVPARLLRGRWTDPLAVASVFSSMFLHGGWFHLLGNMLYLWIFGDNVEDAMGPFRFMLFYLIAGVAAALSQAVPAPESTIPMIGASGAVSGVLGAYLLLYPRAAVLVLIPLGFFSRLIRVPAVLVLLLWFGIQVLQNQLAPEGGAGVAFRAHIGGFIAGMLLVGVFKRPGVRWLR